MLSAIYTVLKEGIFNTRETERYLTFAKDDKRGIFLIRIYGKGQHKIYEFDQFTLFSDLIGALKEGGHIRDEIGLLNAVSTTGVVHGVYEEEGKDVYCYCNPQGGGLAWHIRPKVWKRTTKPVTCKSCLRMMSVETKANRFNSL